MKAASPWSDPNAVTPPDYGRIIRTLTDQELEDEILSGKGEDGYRAALVAEHNRRDRKGAAA